MPKIDTIIRAHATLLTFLASLAVLLTAPSTKALSDASGDVSLVKVSTPNYKPSLAEFEPPLGIYVYETSWQGIPAAESTVKVEQDGDFYHITTNVRTYSGIDLFYKLRYQADGLITKDELLPIRTVIDHRENSRYKRTEISFLENGVINTIRTSKGETKEFSFDPKNLTLDPFAAAFLARSLDWSLGDTRYFDTFNGKSRYLISLTAQEKIRMKVNGEGKDVWVIIPKVDKLPENGSKPKLRDAKIYVTADKSRDILQIVSSVFIGSVKTKMESFTPLPSLSGTRLAQHHKAQRVFFE